MIKVNYVKKPKVGIWDTTSSCKQAYITNHGFTKVIPFSSYSCREWSDFDEPSYHTDENNHMFLNTAYL